VIVPDVNLLVYAYREGTHQHTIARRWWEELVNGQEEIGIPWAVATGFIRIMANPTVMTTPVQPPQTIEVVKAWFSYNHIRPLNPGVLHLQFLRQTLVEAGDSAGVAAANRVPDAHIAALALEQGAEVHTNDTGFARYPGLRWRNPLE